MIKQSTTFAEEVVTGLVYLGITSVDGVEYSGLMIDGKRIVGGNLDPASSGTKPPLDRKAWVTTSGPHWWTSRRCARPIGDRILSKSHPVRDPEAGPGEPYNYEHGTASTIILDTGLVPRVPWYLG